MSFVGIDLGTTNSAICSYDGTTVTPYKSREQHSVTPSAIYIDRRTRYYGARAYDQIPRSPGNVAHLFKRFMGSSTPINVPGAQTVLSPEECSAEILRYLYGYLPEEIRDSDDTGTIITVPAAFDQMQRDATLSAAGMAGIGKVALMQEPVAAVMSVMHRTARDGVFIIYDLGGGTFDVAIAQSGAGRVDLLEHGGIPFCGGRDFDRLLYEHLVAPWLRSTFKLPADFASNKKHGGIRRVAQWAAEKAKIELSFSPSSVISLSEDEVRVNDETGRPIYLDLEIARPALDDLIREHLDETIRETFESLKRCALTNQDVARIVFVGGPTQYKPLRDYVSEQLGIEADLQVDPMMAVAEGAAIFAESIDWNSSKNPPKPMRRTAAASAELQLSFDFAARTPGDRTQIIAKCDDASLDGHQFQIESLDSGWSSGRMKLRSGASCAVRLPRMGANTFLVSLFTRNGAPVSGTESRLTITRVAAVVESIPASHSIGVEGKLSLHGNVTKLFFLVRKGDPLPKKGQEIFKAAEKLSAGDPAALIFKLYEGEIESPVTDNRFVGSLKITGADFESGTIRPGDDLVCEYEVAQSGRLSLVVSVPSIGSSFPSGDLYSRQEGQLDYSESQLAIEEEASATFEKIRNIEVHAKHCQPDPTGPARFSMTRTAPAKIWRQIPKPSRRRRRRFNGPARSWPASGPPTFRLPAKPNWMKQSTRLSA